jgi:hypothetical protein
VSLSTKLKNFSTFQLASIAFYAVTGIILLAFLPLTGFPPHVGFLAILSLITAYSLFATRGWAPWLVAVVLIVNSVFALDTLFSAGFTNVLAGVSMLAYAVFTWVFSAYILLKRKD